MEIMHTGALVHSRCLKHVLGLLPVPPTLTLVPPKLSLFSLLPIVKNKRRKRKNSEKKVLPHCSPAPYTPKTNLFDLATAGAFKI